MGYQFDWFVLWEYRHVLWDGFCLTMVLFFWGTLFSLGASLLLGVVGASRHWVPARAVDLYVEFNRNTPLVVKMFFLYFAFSFDAFTAAVAALALHQSAYMAEVVRAGIQTIARGQIEAGLSSGFTRRAVMSRIVLPQALMIIIPPMTTQILEVLKNTSIAMTISVEEVTFQTQQIEALTFRGFEAATAGTIAYLLVGLMVAGAAIKLEQVLQLRVGITSRRGKSALVPRL
ncbi:MAG: amino acid ABC transporter permease [Dongiaceae bacterium]